VFGGRVHEPPTCDLRAGNGPSRQHGRLSRGPLFQFSEEAGWAATAAGSDVVIEMELVRMRTQPDGIDFLLPLVVEPGPDRVGSEHISA
jgi:hypothetical protein